MINETCETLEELMAFIERHPINSVLPDNNPVLAVGYFRICYWSQLIALVTALREAEQRAEAAEKVIDHYLDEKNWEASPISGNAVLYVPAFLHGNAIAADYRIKYPKNAALTQDG